MANQLKNHKILLAIISMSVGAWTAKAQFCSADAAPAPNGAAPFRAKICDLNIDGLPDIISANADTDNITVHMALPGGGFADPQIFSAGDEPVDADCCDVDGDGKIDIVTANRSASQVNVLKNQGFVGNLIELVAPVPYSVGVAPWGVRCVQLNADTKPELVTSNFTGTSVSVLVNHGDGTFAPHQDILTGGNGTYYIATCDLDGDNDEDVIVSNLTGQSMTSFRNEGSGTLTKIGTYSVGVLIFPWGITCCDVNGDGHPDAVTANGGDNTISVMLNDGFGHFSVGAPLVFEGPGQPFGIACADIDRDGDADILTSNLSSDDVSIMINDGHAHFQLDQSLPVGLNVGSVQVADMDLDGDLDVVATAGTNALLFENACLPGDFNGDGVVDWNDHALLAECLLGPDVMSLSSCRRMDLNNDLSVDLFDWSAFQLSLHP